MKDAKIFDVTKDEEGNMEKCGGCNWGVDRVFLVAESREEAEEAYKENGRGLCGRCLVEWLKESGAKIEVE